MYGILRKQLLALICAVEVSAMVPSFVQDKDDDDDNCDHHYQNEHSCDHSVLDSPVSNQQIQWTITW